MLHRLISVNSPDLIFLSEPMAQSSSSASIVQSSGFDSCLPNTNNSIWCLYKSSSNLTLTLRDQSSQHITVNVADSSSLSPSFITAVYGSTDYRIRRSLWNYLVSVSSTVLPWSIIGDFNAILLASLKISTRPPASISVKDFNDMVMSTGLKDLG